MNGTPVIVALSWCGVSIDLRPVQTITIFQRWAWVLSCATGSCDVTISGLLDTLVKDHRYTSSSITHSKHVLSVTEGPFTTFVRDCWHLWSFHLLLIVISIRWVWKIWILLAINYVHIRKRFISLEYAREFLNTGAYLPKLLPVVPKGVQAFAHHHYGHFVPFRVVQLCFYWMLYWRESNKAYQKLAV